MTKIIDCFLFHEELDLLEIRLEFLYEFVDQFIILESCQSHSGKKKPFIFEKNKSRFQKYLNKIHYHKIEEMFYSYSDLKNKLISSPCNKIDMKILQILESHDHYPKKDLNWVLDTFQRETMHIPMNKLCKDNDLIIFSDLDEIPALELIQEYQTKNYQKLITAKQSHFNIYLNCYRDSEWIGTIIGDYKYFKNKSLNLIRKNSKYDCDEIQHLPVKGGYHFSWIGNANKIINKLETSAHQEFNFSFLKKLLRKNTFNLILVFSIYSKINYQILSLDKTILYETKMLNILRKYKHLIYSENLPKKYFFKNYFIKVLFVIIYFYIRLIKLYKKNNEY